MGKKFVAYLTPCPLHWQSVVSLSVYFHTRVLSCYSLNMIRDARVHISWMLFSASRGVACVFSSRRHALVYILDEDEDEDEDESSDME